MSGEGNTYLVEVSRVTGTFVTPPTFAVYLLLLLPLSVLLVGWCRGRNGVAMLTLLGLVAGLLLLTYTRIRLVRSAGERLVPGHSLAARGLLLLVAAVAVLVIAVPSVTSRFADLNAPPTRGGRSFQLAFLAHQLLAAPRSRGCREPRHRSRVRCAEAHRTRAPPAHNVFVQAYVETGVIGLACVLAIIWTMSKMLRDRLRNAASGWSRLLALGAMGAALAILLELPGENLLSQTFVYWYSPSR